MTKAKTVGDRIRSTMKAQAVEQTTYLSTSGGQWRAIHQGLPLCADTTLERARSVLEQYGFEVGEVAWNGDRSEWVHVSTIEE